MFYFQNAMVLETQRFTPSESLAGTFTFLNDKICEILAGSLTSTNCVLQNFAHLSYFLPTSFFFNHFACIKESSMSILQIGQCLMSSSFLQYREEGRGSVLIIYAPSVQWRTPLASTHLCMHRHKLTLRRVLFRMNQ